MIMTKINAEPHALNRKMPGCPSPSWARAAILMGSLATVGLASVPKLAHAAPPSVPVPCAPQQVLVNAINSAASGDVLSLTQGCVYVLTSPISNPPDPTLGDSGLLINNTLTIKGNGATITRTSAQKFRIFLVASQAADLTISDLTIDNGDTSGTGAKDGRGGGILNLGSLKVTNSTFSRNHGSFGSAGIGNGIPQEGGGGTSNLMLSDSVFFDNVAGLVGGAIGNGDGSTMNLTGCTISHNTAVGDGGGIANQGIAILNKCIISGNTVTGSFPGLPGGGGIINAGQLFLTASDITGNSSASDGGGIVNGGQMALTHTNVTGNKAMGNGGGIANVSLGATTPATLTLVHTDVTNNTAGQGHPGGGVFNQAGNTANLNQSTVVFNTPDDCNFSCPVMTSAVSTPR
jgi:hypothetical protein